MDMEFRDLKELLIFNIKYYRYLNGISQEKLAEYCGVSPHYISDIEIGRHCPTINKIEIIAKCLNVEPYVLFQNLTRDDAVIKKIGGSRQYNQN